MPGLIYLHGHEPIVNQNFFCEKIRPNGRFVTCTEFLVDLFARLAADCAKAYRLTYVLVHQARLPNSTVAQYDDL